MHCISGSSSVASKFEELECLYAAVGKVIYEGLTNYEKATNANPSQLFGKCGIHYESLWDVVLTMVSIFGTRLMVYQAAAV